MPETDRAFVTEVLECLRELADEMEAELVLRYSSRSSYAGEQRRFLRDMGPVKRARSLLARAER